MLLFVRVAEVGVYRPLRGKRGGRSMGGGCAGVACCVGVCVCLQRRACVVSCRPGGLEEKLAVFCGRSKDFADEHAYLVTSWSVVGGAYASSRLRPTRRRILWTVWYPQLRDCCGLGGGVLPRVWAWPDLCVGGEDGPHPEYGPRG